MGKKKKGKKKEKKIEEPEIPPEDPLDKLTEEQLKFYTECFQMFDPKHQGFIDSDRVIDIFEDMTDEKVDVDRIKSLVNKVRIK
jgi:Ca2+-binding EF-hand superfamily protein